jgi:hypothetical protein
LCAGLSKSRAYAAIKRNATNKLTNNQCKNNTTKGHDPMDIEDDERPMLDTPTESADETIAVTQRMQAAGIQLVGPHHIHVRCSNCGSIWSPVMAEDASLKVGWWRCPEGCWSTASVKPLEERRARWREMWRARHQGQTYEQIGESFGITRQRACFILNGGEPKPNGRPRKEASA